MAGRRSRGPPPPAPPASSVPGGRRPIPPARPLAVGPRADMETEANSVADRAAPTSAAHAKVIVVMPARNAARTLEATVSATPTDVVDEVILFDDKSTDAPLDVARRLPLHLIWHPHN